MNRGPLLNYHWSLVRAFPGLKSEILKFPQVVHGVESLRLWLLAGWCILGRAGRSKIGISAQ